MLGISKKVYRIIPRLLSLPFLSKKMVDGRWLVSEADSQPCAASTMARTTAIGLWPLAPVLRRAHLVYCPVVTMLKFSVSLDQGPCIFILCPAYKLCPWSPSSVLAGSGATGTALG